MYLGEIVELAGSEEVYRRPLHPYTRALLSAVPSVRPGTSRRIRLDGEPPDPAEPPPGCKFHPRCPIAQEICRTRTPRLESWLPGRLAACHFALAGPDATKESAPRLHAQAVAARDRDAVGPVMTA
jgi:oligopeptide/dipeptide ABC transporter ATP-binding protein